MAMSFEGSTFMHLHVLNKNSAQQYSFASVFPIARNLENCKKLSFGYQYKLWDGGNLKQTLCVQCAQQLRNFSKFREQSLRARSLMVELLETHELITIQHIKMIQHANNTLRNNLVSTTFGPDPCDMNIVQENPDEEPCDMYTVENSDEDRQNVSEETVHGVAIKNECSEVSQWEAEDTQMIIEENADCVKEEFTIDQFTCEGTLFMCTVCCERFPHEHAYSALVHTHLHDARPAAASPHTAETSLSARLATTQHSERELVTSSGASDNRAPDSDHSTNTDDKSYVGNLYDILKYPQNAKIKVESLPQTLKAFISGDILNAHTACEDAQYRAVSEDEVAATHKEPAVSVLSETEPGTSGHSSRTRTFTCNVCERAFTRKDHLVTHMNSHTGDKPYSCDICSYKCKRKCYLDIHMRIHTDEKPYSCKICSYKCTQNSSLVKHIRTHTGEKPYSCDICSYKCIRKCNLDIHMRIHTGEKPYSCKICSYKCTQNSALVKHIRTHTGEKPYSCDICSYKCITKCNLDIHMRIHTGEKPYSCKICSYKCTQNSALVKHIRVHTGEKPYSCKICRNNFANKSHLVTHMRRHTGEKPYSCETCSYKCTTKSSLVRHTRTHTGAH